MELQQNRLRRRCWTTAPIRRRRRAPAPPARRRSCWRRLAVTRFASAPRADVAISSPNMVRALPLPAVPLAGGRAALTRPRRRRERDRPLRVVGAHARGVFRPRGHRQAAAGPWGVASDHLGQGTAATAGAGGGAAARSAASRACGRKVRVRRVGRARRPSPSRGTAGSKPSSRCWRRRRRRPRGRPPNWRASPLPELCSWPCCTETGYSSHLVTRARSNAGPPLLA